jgi:hypothetical protein
VVYLTLGADPGDHQFFTVERKILFPLGITLNLAGCNWHKTDQTRVDHKMIACLLPPFGLQIRDSLLLDNA